MYEKVREAGNLDILNRICRYSRDYQYGEILRTGKKESERSRYKCN